MAVCHECGGDGYFEVEYTVGGVNSNGPWQGYRTGREECPECFGKGYTLHSPNCPFCDEHKGDPMMPAHHASRNCRSGGKDHCTCDVCY